MSGLMEIEVKLPKREVIVESKDKTNRERLKIQVDPQRIRFPKDYNYNQFLLDKVIVNVDFGASTKKENWKAQIRKGWISDDIDLNTDEKDRGVVFGLPVIARIKYRVGGILQVGIISILVFFLLIWGLWKGWKRFIKKH